MIQIKPLHILCLLLLISMGLNIYFFSKPKEKVTIPPIIGKFEPAQPISQKPVGEPLTIAWKKEKEIIYVETEGKVNDSLLSFYRDSIGQIQSELEREKQRFALYLDAITLREFEQDFENSYLKLTVAGEVQGHLKSLSIPQFEIKSREIEVPSKKFSIGPYIGIDFRGRVSGGVGVSYSIWEF